MSEYFWFREGWPVCLFSSEILPKYLNFRFENCKNEYYLEYSNNMDSFQTMVQWKCLQMKITWSCVKRETLVYGSTIEWCLYSPDKPKNNDEVAADKAYHYNLLKGCVLCHCFSSVWISHFWFVWRYPGL